MPDNQPSVKCPECGKRYRLKMELLGRKIRCKACDTLFRVPLHPESDSVVGVKIQSNKEAEPTPKPARTRRPAKPKPPAFDQGTPVPLTEGARPKNQTPELKDLAEEDLKIPMDDDFDSSLDSRTDYDLNIVSDSYVERHIEEQKKLQAVEEDDPLADSVAKGNIDDLDDGLGPMKAGLGSTLDRLNEQEKISPGSDDDGLDSDPFAPTDKQPRREKKKKKRWGLGFK